MGLFVLASGAQAVPGCHFILPFGRDNFLYPLDRASQPNSGTRKFHPVKIRRGTRCCSSPYYDSAARMFPLFVNNPEAHKRPDSVERHIIEHALINIRLTQELAHLCCRHRLVSAPALHPNKWAINESMPSANTGNRPVVLSRFNRRRPSHLSFTVRLTTVAANFR